MIFVCNELTLKKKKLNNILILFFSSNSSCKSSLTDLSQISTVSEDEKETVPAVRNCFDWLQCNMERFNQWNNYVNEIYFA